MAKVARSHPSVDWSAYFWGIRTECPWSWAAWQQGQILVRPWQGQPVQLAQGETCVYTVLMSQTQLIRRAQQLDQESLEYAWLYSYPGLGAWATPVPVLIQQNQQRLQHLRDQLGE